MKLNNHVRLAEYGNLIWIDELTLAPLDVAK